MADVRPEPSLDALPVHPQMFPVRPSPDIPVVASGRSVSGCFQEQVVVPDTSVEAPSAASLHDAVPAHLPPVPQAPPQSAPAPLPQPLQRLELAVLPQARLPQQGLPPQQQASQPPAALAGPMPQQEAQPMQPAGEQPLPRRQGDWRSQARYRSAQVASESEPHDAELEAQGAQRQPVQQQQARVQASVAQPSAPISPQPGGGSLAAQP